MCYKGWWEKKNDKDELVDFDANSLYGSVMCNSLLTFPDIRSAEIQTQIELQTLINTYPHFIAEIDITVPESVKFIPVATKTQSGKGCRYMYGTFQNQFYNEVDIKEALKAGCKFGKVHRALCFKKSIPNILANFSNMI